MQYSLFSRFQGCFLGMALGERLGVDAQRVSGSSTPVRSQPVQSQPSFDQVGVPQVKPLQADLLQGQSHQTRSLQTRSLQWALNYAEKLSQTGQWDGQLEPWNRKEGEKTEPPLSSQPLSSHLLSSDRPNTSRATSDELAIAILPISLFFHDDLVQQRHYLRQTIQQLGGNPSMEDWGVLLGYAIAQAVKEQLNFHAFVPQMMAYLRVAAPEIWQRSPHLVQALELIKTSLEQDVGLTKVALKLQCLDPSPIHFPGGNLSGSNLSGNDLSGSNLSEIHPSDRTSPWADPGMVAIALAIYCFVRTPDNFHLTLTQAVSMHHLSSIHTSPIQASHSIPFHSMGVLAAALSGAHNSAASIPVHWLISGLTPPLGQSAEGFYSPQTIQNLSLRLLEAWSGIHNPCQHHSSHQSTCQQSIEPHPVVAAPWIIRP